ncbi:DUF1772 domain-containing protein [Ralstonia solanacearum]|uniref:DUF1772 domain-containing protein n=1 Tax=Ralstonia solanacearum TaxID=305 RepID=A0AAW5ZVI2_RALSL|nr:anthrone oxygenase family protein [Ralstonia solanacearum]MDB0573941.1 DUF1772 domain-containing protein [Ralstonia solanacearum]
MHMTLRLIFNMLAVCGTGVFNGALLFIGVTLGAYWKSLPPVEFLEWFSRNSHFIARSLPVCLAASVVGLAGSLWADWQSEQQRYLWCAALLCIAVLLIITSLYNGPMNRQFSSRSMLPDQVPKALKIWLATHAARIALSQTASAIAVFAIGR